MPKGKTQAVHSANGVSSGQIIGLDGSKVHFFGFKGNLPNNSMVDFELFSPKEIVGLSSASKGPIAKSVNGFKTTIPSKLTKKKQGV